MLIFIPRKSVTVKLFQKKNQNHKPASLYGRYLKLELFLQVASITFLFNLSLHYKFGNEVCLEPFRLELMTSTFNGLRYRRIIYLRQYGQK